MRYSNPQLVQRLAAEYVLGTLTGRARRRFERWMTDSYHVRSAVWHWERQLNPLAEAAASVQPRSHVWERVLERTGAAAAARAEQETSRVPWFERLGLWRGLSLVATAAAVVLAVLLARTPTEVVAPQAQQFVSVVNGEQSQPLWLVRADVQQGRLTIKSINATAPAATNSYELWILPAGGAAPRSLGLLPTGTAAVDAELPVELRPLLASAQGLAVSLEPAGGSPTGAPTGPVVYQAAILSI
ncbi:MAG TPA: anti-sigma factor [Steroidobacter sp.]|uniref:anti-sigma factor n=1 Tax=Steroidobacter sp. TaxID=1978227 RepID=UPI002EDAC0CC